MDLANQCEDTGCYALASRFYAEALEYVDSASFRESLIRVGADQAMARASRSMATASNLAALIQRNRELALQSTAAAESILSADTEDLLKNADGWAEIELKGIREMTAARMSYVRELMAAGALEEAESHLSKAYESFKTQNARMEMAECCFLTSEIRAQQRQYDESVECISNALMAAEAQ